MGECWEACWVLGCPESARNASRVPGGLEGAGDAQRVPGCSQKAVMLTGCWVPAGAGYLQGSEMLTRCQDAHRVPGCSESTRMLEGYQDTHSVPECPQVLRCPQVPGYSRGTGMLIGCRDARRVPGCPQGAGAGPAAGLWCHLVGYRLPPPRRLGPRGSRPGGRERAVPVCWPRGAAALIYESPDGAGPGPALLWDAGFGFPIGGIWFPCISTGSPWLPPAVCWGWTTGSRAPVEL